MRNKNFWLDDETHKKLKLFAVERSVRIGDAIKLLLDKNEGTTYSCDSQHKNDNKGDNKL